MGSLLQWYRYVKGLKWTRPPSRASRAWLASRRRGLPWRPNSRPKDHAAVSAAAAAVAAVLESATEGEKESVPLWRPCDEYASQVLFDSYQLPQRIISPGNDGLVNASRTSNPSSTPTSGREEFGKGMPVAFWWRIVVDNSVSVPHWRFWKLFLPSIYRLTSLGGKCRPGSASARRGCGRVTTGAMR